MGELNGKPIEIATGKTRDFLKGTYTGDERESFERINALYELLENLTTLLAETRPVQDSDKENSVMMDPKAVLESVKTMLGNVQISSAENQALISRVATRVRGIESNPEMCKNICEFLMLGQRFHVLGDSFRKLYGKGYATALDRLIGNVKRMKAFLRKYRPETTEEELRVLFPRWNSWNSRHRKLS